jgi:hypothetical protein
MLHIRTRIGALCLAGTLLVAGGCADLPSARTDAAGLEKIGVQRGPSFSLEGESAASAKVIGPQGGEISTASGHRIVFPAGALSRPTEISMRDDAQHVGVRLQPHGLTFPAGRSPVLTLAVSESAVAAYDFLRVVYVDDAGTILEVLDTRTHDGSVSTNLRHFSGYLIGGGRQ